MFHMHVLRACVSLDVTLFGIPVVAVRSVHPVLQGELSTSLVSSTGHMTKTDVVCALAKRVRQIYVYIHIYICVHTISPGACNWSIIGRCMTRRSIRPTHVCNCMDTYNTYNHIYMHLQNIWKRSKPLIFQVFLHFRSALPLKFTTRSHMQISLRKVYYSTECCALSWLDHKNTSMIPHVCISSGKPDPVPLKLGAAAIFIAVLPFWASRQDIRRFLYPLSTMG